MCLSLFFMIIWSWFLRFKCTYTLEHAENMIHFVLLIVWNFWKSQFSFFSRKKYMLEMAGNAVGTVYHTFGLQIQMSL